MGIMMMIMTDTEVAFMRSKCFTHVNSLNAHHSPMRSATAILINNRNNNSNI